MENSIIDWRAEAGEARYHVYIVDKKPRGWWKWKATREGEDVVVAEGIIDRITDAGGAIARITGEVFRQELAWTHDTLERVKRQRDMLLAACKEAVWEDSGMYCTSQLRAAIAEVEGASDDETTQG